MFSDLFTEGPSSHILSNQDGYSALMWVALHDRATMVTLLLDRGACIDSADKVVALFARIVFCR